MTGYAAPLDDMAFVLNELVGLGEIAALPGYEQATPELAEAVLAEGGRFAAEVLAPLNRIGDLQGCRLENGVVRTAEGFREAYARFVEAGWNGVAAERAEGGQGLPWVLATALQEMWNAANMAFALCPLLTQSAIELLVRHGTPAQRRTYLPNLVSGRWAGTMNLTEPQAGSDVGAVRCRAVRAGDGYRLFGQKIFITYGEHDLAENIIHMVLARTPDAPAGIKGISLFIVPKLLVAPDGRLLARNDVRCVSLEEKLGIHASPTAVMAYGDNGGAVGYLVGEEHRGIEYMFTMMNTARLAIGVQGLAIAERAYQQARDFARARLQGRPAGTALPGPVPIIRHPDVRRMLMTMRASTEAMRALLYFTAGAIDRAKRHPDAAERAQNQALADLMIPVAKGWCTDTGCAVASLAIQVHGGVGFIEQTGMSQLFRDVRITPIYEGTNGIQANDLVGRKLARDGSATLESFIAGLRQTERDLAAAPGEEAKAIRARFAPAVESLSAATRHLVRLYPRETATALAVAAPYLALFGTVAGGWLLAESALAAWRQGDGAAPSAALAAKPVVARFFAEHLLPGAEALATTVLHGGESAMALPEDRF